MRETMEWHHGNQGLLERLLPDGRWVQIAERHNPTGGIVGIRTDITVLKQTMTDLAAPMSEPARLSRKCVSRTWLSPSAIRSCA